MFRRIPNVSKAVTMLFVVAGSAALVAEVRVQDIATLQGQRTNKLQGFGLVVGLKGTGDGGRNPRTVRALERLHQRYSQPVLDVNDLRQDENVAVVSVEATIPEYGAREGQALDVVVAAFGAKSLEGGQLLTTPLQYAMFRKDDLATQQILALAGGRLQIPDAKTPTRALIRQGATLEDDFFYNFIEDDAVTLVLHDAQAGYPLAQMVARAINLELANPQAGGVFEQGPQGALVVVNDLAIAAGPKNVRVRIPSYELASPAGFISRVLQTPLFTLPQQPARVVINRTTKGISFTGTVTIAPTVLQIPGMGTVTVGGGGKDQPTVVGMDSEKAGGVEFQQLMDTLGALKLSAQQMVDAVEQLHRTGTLHGQLIYTE